MNGGGCLQAREQDFVVDARGVCMSIPATYTRHPFKVMEMEYVQSRTLVDNR